jgi:hypothetical protein
LVVNRNLNTLLMQFGFAYREQSGSRTVDRQGALFFTPVRAVMPRTPTSLR